MLIATIHRAAGSKTAKPHDFSMAKQASSSAPDPSDGAQFVKHVKKVLASTKPQRVLPPRRQRQRPQQGGK